MLLYNFASFSVVPVFLLATPEVEFWFL